MKKILSLILTLCLIVTGVAVMGIGANVSVSAASQYAETSTAVEGGNILYCMCWSYNTILANQVKFQQVYIVSLSSSNGNT